MNDYVLSKYNRVYFRPNSERECERERVYFRVGFDLISIFICWVVNKSPFVAQIADVSS